MDGVDQYTSEMEAAWDYVDAHYHTEEIFGDDGSQIILRLATRASHPELPYALSILAGLVGCANGARISVFPCDDLAPISMVFLNINYPQTRKSQIASAIAKIGTAADKKAQKRAQTAAAADAPQVTLWSTTLSSFTEPAFFQRCAGDWCQNTDENAPEAVSGRFHFSTLLNLDEAYKFLKMLGLVSQASSGDKKVDAAAVPDAASEFNKLMQVGRSALATKTAGSFGGDDTPPVNVAGVGNLHPSVWIPVERCEAGKNHAASKERLLVATGRPIEPHHGVPQRLQLDPQFRRWVWSPLLHVMVEPLGLRPGSDDPAQASVLYERCAATGEDGSDGEEDREQEFVPDSRGYHITLVDGYATRLRFRVMTEGGVRRLLPEFRVANRHISVPPGENTVDMADRVLAYFSALNMDITWSARAVTLFQGFSAVFHANTAAVRTGNMASHAARLGAAPWHLSVLSTALFIFEIGEGQHDGTDALKKKELEVQESHVVRAFKLLTFIHGISKCWARPCGGQQSEAHVSQHSLAAAAARLSAPDASGILPKSQFGNFALTQPAPEAAEPDSPVAATPHAEAHAEEIASARDEPEPKLLQLSDASLPPMSEGYGIGGATVQDSALGAVVLSDREIMQKTLLRGEAVIFGRRVIDSLAVKKRRPGGTGAGYTKESVKLAHWKAVMQHGLAKYRVGRYDAGDQCADYPNQPRILLDLPADGDKKLMAEFHNRLMLLCQLPYDKLSGCVLRRHQKGAPAGGAPAQASRGRRGAPLAQGVGAGAPARDVEAAPAGEVAASASVVGPAAQLPVRRLGGDF